MPVEELTQEFAAGATPEDVCARSIRTLLDLGVRNFYVSNLPLRRTAQTLNAILDRAGVHGGAVGIGGTRRTARSTLNRHGAPQHAALGSRNHDMGSFLDSVPVSAIIKIRDLMVTVKDPFRLDQGDVSFDAPDTVKKAMADAIVANHTHYLPTTGVPKLRQLLAEKLRRKNRIPVESDQDIVPTNGGTHAIWAVMHAMFEPGDELIVPDPEWPPTMAIATAAKATPVGVPIYEKLGWRWDLDELERAITPRTRAIYVNSPNNPTGGVLTRSDLERIAAIATERKLWVISDEAYEDIIYKGEHVSIASLPGMYERTISIFTFSKSYAITGLRLGYFVMPDKVLKDRAIKVVAYTTSNVSSIVQYAGIGALEGPQDVVVGVSRRAQGAARPVLRRACGCGAGNPERRPAGWRVLRVRPYQCRLGARGRASWAIGLVGDGGAPDQERTHRLCARRRLRTQCRRLSAPLFRPQPQRAGRRAGLDEERPAAGRHAGLSGRPHVVIWRSGDLAI